MNIDKLCLGELDREGREKVNLKIDKIKAVRHTVIGKSILGIDIDCFSVGKGKKFVLYLGTHHALESITSNLIYIMIGAISDSKQFNELSCGFDYTSLLSSFTYLFIPCVNPDGVEMRLHGCKGSPLRERQMKMSGGNFSAWQSNARGVDLNHNYNAGFYEYKRIESERGIEAGNTLYSGEYPESEPETRAIASLIRTLAPSLVVSLHAQGEEIYATENAVGCALWLEKKIAYRLTQTKDTAMFGGLTDYMGLIGIKALTVEVGRGENPLPISDIPNLADRLTAPLLTLPTTL